MPAPSDKGTLYLISTPIGNLQDITLRALEVLKKVDGVAAEDTRVSVRLLEAHGIRKTITPYHDHNRAWKEDVILQELKRGHSIALLTDAGTPGISDPGAILVRRCQRDGIPVVPIPGPSAVTALLAAAGMDADAFVFVGFPPPKQGPRQELFRLWAAAPGPVVFFEAPHRVFETLNDLLAVLGDREIAMGRELTKIHEEIRRGPVSELRERFRDEPPRGEFVFAVAPGKTAPVERTDDEILAALRDLMKEDAVRRKDAVAAVANDLGVDRKRTYKLSLRLNAEARTEPRKHEDTKNTKEA